MSKSSTGLESSSEATYPSVLDATTAHDQHAEEQQDGQEEEDDEDEQEEEQEGESAAASESGKFRQLLGILRKAINVKDLSSLRISLPGNLMEPIGNLEAWQYADRPDVFATMGQSNDELQRMLAVLRWTFTKDLKFTKHKIVKPYNSILGEHFHCHWDVVAPAFDPSTGEIMIEHHLDLSPTVDILAAAGRPPTHIISRPTAAAVPTTTSSLARSPATSTLSTSAPSSPALEDLLASTTLHSSSSSSSSSTRLSMHEGMTLLASSTSIATTTNTTLHEEQGNGRTRVVFLNEQTSHHPPISNFRIEARGPHGRVSAVGADQLSAKFTGTTVKVYPGPHNFGIFVRLHDHDEEYQITHPTATIAGLIRASPYVTIGEQTTITLRSISEIDSDEKVERKPRLRCIIAYAEESWLMRPRFLLSGVIYRCETEADEEISKVKYVAASKIVATFEGNWRGEIKWKRPNEKVSKSLIDLLPLCVLPKTVAPLEQQAPLETRKVWEEVTRHLLAKEYSSATRAKQALEQVQRLKAETRKLSKTEHVPTFFQAEGEDWEGRPVLTREGEEAIEKEFKADYSDPIVA